MATPAATAMPPQLVVERRENPIVSFFIIVQPLDEHFFLRWKTIVAGILYVFVDLVQTVFAKTVIVGAGKELNRFGRQGGCAALAVADIAHLADEGAAATGTIFFFVFIHTCLP